MSNITHSYPPLASPGTKIDVEQRICAGFRVQRTGSWPSDIRYLSKVGGTGEEGQIMKVAAQTIIASCPDCGEKIDLGPQPEEGQIVTCPECWAYLKVISLEPLILGWDTFELEDEEDEAQDED